MNDYKPAQKNIDVSVGESVRIIRELQELSQNALSAITGIPQSTLSAIEHNRVNLGVERAKVLARALKCHPAVLVFPGWETDCNAAESRYSEHNRYKHQQDSTTDSEPQVFKNAPISA